MPYRYSAFFINYTNCPDKAPVPTSKNKVSYSGSHPTPGRCPLEGEEVGTQGRGKEKFMTRTKGDTYIRQTNNI